jgi:hypothetical protein
MAITVEAYFRRESIVCFVDMGGIVDHTTYYHKYE